MATFSSGVKCFRSFLIRSLRYLNGRTRSPFPTEAGQNDKLEEMIKVHGYIYYPSIGATVDHSEESFTVENISEADAVFLGSSFEQSAILFNDARGPRFKFGAR